MKACFFQLKKMGEIQVIVLALLLSSQLINSQYNTSSPSNTTKIMVTGMTSDDTSDNSNSTNMPSVTPTFQSSTIMNSSSAIQTKNTSSSMATTTSTVERTISEISATKSPPTECTPTMSPPTTSPPTTSPPTTSPPTTSSTYNGMILVGSIIGGIFLLMLAIILLIVLCKRCFTNTSTQDTWVVSHSGPTSNDFDNSPDDKADNTSLRRQSLSTFVSKKLKRKSLLDQYDMEVKESDGILNTSTDIEKNTLPSEIKVENKMEKETNVDGTTESPELPPPPPEAQSPSNKNDYELLKEALPATSTPEILDVPKEITPPPPSTDLLSFVDDLPPPPPELQV